jgi:hypothetical protein
VIDFLPAVSASPQCAVVEIRTHDWDHAQAGFEAVSSNDFDELDLSTTHRLALHGILAGDDQSRGPCARPGWIDEAIEWIHASTADRVDKEIRQFNAGGSFALIRFGRPDGPAYWLKATGPPNLHEFGITACLTALCPNYLPALIAMRADWNAWVMEDAGTTLGRQANVLTLECATRSLAELQKQTVGHTHELRKAGATDQRTEALREHVGEIIAYLEEAMDLQTSVRVPRLEPSRLREIGSILTDACCVTEELRIPETVIHNDLNHGNILLRENACVFIDWCEVSIGNPFITFQHLLMLLPSDGDNTEADRASLRLTYKKRWLDIVPESKVDKMSALAPLLAITAYLYGRGDWLRSQRRYEPEVQSYARSLARHMDRAAKNPSLLGVLCH